jgi:hypothetical protein
LGPRRARGIRATRKARCVLSSAPS